MSRLFSILVLLAACVNILPARCSNERVVHLGTFSRAVDYAPYIVAKQKHLFDAALKACNATPAYEEFQSLPTINEAFATKKLDAVLESEAPCIVGKAAGIDLKILAVSSLVEVPVIVHTKSDITSVAGLRGKKVAVLAGTSAHYVLCKVLEGAGLSKNDVSIVNMTPPDAKSAFDSNKIDAWAIWPPFVEQEELAGTGKCLPKASGVVDVVMVVRADFVKDSPKIAGALVEVLKSARSWVSAHPAEAQEIVAKELKLPLPVVQKAWSRQDWTSTIDKKLTDDVQKKADFLKSVGLVRNVVDVKSLMQSAPN